MQARPTVRELIAQREMAEKENLAAPDGAARPAAQSRVAPTVASPASVASAPATSEDKASAAVNDPSPADAKSPVDDYLKAIRATSDILGNALKQIDDMQLLQQSDIAIKINWSILFNEQGTVGGLVVQDKDIYSSRVELAKKIMVELKKIDSRNAKEVSEVLINKDKQYALKHALLSIARVDSKLLSSLENGLQFYKKFSTVRGDIQKFFNKKKLSNTHMIINEVTIAVQAWESKLRPQPKLSLFFFMLLTDRDRKGVITAPAKLARY